MSMENYDYTNVTPCKELIEEIKDYFSDDELSIQILSGTDKEKGVVILNGRVTSISFKWSKLETDYHNLKQYLIDSLKIEKLENEKDKVDEMYKQLFKSLRDICIDGILDTSYENFQFLKDTLEREKKMNKRVKDKYHLLYKFFDDMEERFYNINLVIDEVRKKHDDKWVIGKGE